MLMLLGTTTVCLVTALSEVGTSVWLVSHGCPLGAGLPVQVM